MKNKLITNLNRNITKVGLRLKKHSPEILTIAGVAGTLVSTLLACRATTKVGEILDNSKETLNDIHKGMENGNINGESYTKEDGKKDTTIVYVRTGLKIAKLYAPSAILGTLSLTGIITSHNIMKKRNVALAAAYATVDASFKDYRKGVIERFGSEVDKELKYHIKAKTVQEVTTDENGVEIVEEKKVAVTDNKDNIISDFTVWFNSDTSTAWETDNYYNEAMLRGKQSWFNDRLKAEGVIYLNDIYYELGMKRTKAGQIVGWVYKPDDDSYKGDGYIDFGIQKVMVENDGEYEEAILLDFNVDGNVLDLM